MESVGSQVIDAVLQLLKATGYPSFRTRLSSFPSEQTPAFNVFPAETVPSLIATGEQQHTLRLTVDCIAFAADEVDVAIDPLYVAADKALQADLTLGGLVQAIRLKSMVWKTEKRAEQDVVVLELGYEAEFSTVRGDPSTAAA